MAHNMIDLVSFSLCFMKPTYVLDLLCLLFVSLENIEYSEKNIDTFVQIFSCKRDNKIDNYLKYQKSW